MLTILSSIDPGQPGKELLEIIILDCNSLDLDAMLKFDKISKMDTSSLDSDLKNYFSVTRDRYEFN